MLGRRVVTEHAHAVRVVDVQQRAVLLGQGVVRTQRRDVAAHRIHAVCRDDLDPVATRLELAFHVSGVAAAYSDDVGPARLRELGRFEDRGVCAVVDEDGARTGEPRQHPEVQKRDRREHHGVGGADERGEIAFETAVGQW